MRVPRGLVMGVLALILTTGGPGTAGADDRDRVVVMSGLVYVFGSSTLVPGALLSLEEYPDIRTTADRNGHFVLEVPDGVEVTPVIRMPGFRTMHLQTFETEGEDIENVFIQFFPQVVYDRLACGMGVNPADPDMCHVFSTVSDHRIQGMTFEDFVEFTAENRGHGVSGATAGARPKMLPYVMTALGLLPRPIYFNEDVVPDVARIETSLNGGVIWLDVPHRTHQFRAWHADARFFKFTAKCAPGRFINACPPWGLREKKPNRKKNP